jgi:PAS domain S-box-containing protein
MTKKLQSKVEIAIRHRVALTLSVAFALLIIILIGIGWLGLNRMGRVDTELNEIFDKRWSKVQLTREIVRYSSLNQQLTLQVFLQTSKEDVAPFLARRNANAAAISKLLQQVRDGIDSKEENEHLAALLAAREKFAASYRQAVDLVMTHNDIARAREEMSGVTVPLQMQYNDVVENFVQFETDQMNQARSRSQANYIVARRMVRSLILIAIALATWIAVFITRKTARNDAEREVSNEQFRKLNEGLEAKVRERTEKLEHEIVDRKQYADDLRRLAVIVESSRDAIVSETLEGVIVSWNPGAERLFGYSAAEAIGQSVTFLSPPDRTTETPDLFEKVKRNESVESFETVRMRKDGTPIQVALTLSAIKDDGGAIVGISAIARDITEQRALEKHLRQSQKMEAIGQLSGGIAHDFNNLLGVITGHAEIVAERLASDSDLRKNLVEINKAAQTAASLTRQLLAFSRQQVLAPQVLDLNAVVVNVEKMLRRLIGEHVELKTELDPTAGRIKADQGQIEQVILNLIVNARDAMPQGGTIVIETACVEVDEDYSHQHSPQTPGSYVLLSVSDNGIGMSADIQAHIFEPFFTTKELGKGTGLGLATVYGVVRQSGGHIWVYSEPGHGSTLKVYLPRCEAAVRGAQKSSVSRGESLRGQETILLVEDEEALRELIHSFLAESGYRVLEADRPDRAIEIASQFHGPIHLLLTDVVMPRMNGPTLARTLLLTRPEMRVVFVSGYTSFSQPCLLDQDAILVQKPFTRSVLLQRLREAFDLTIETKTI